ncbi:hypothetical protein IBT46_15180 [Erwinia sp. S38]|nr:hypothetical protein [Erwinia sp. S38]MBK0002578.1 hypothetical protein [Erwinia sp. S38]
MIKKTLLAGMLLTTLTGCSVATYSHKLQDVESGDRVGISFDNRNLDYMRVYPNTAECINLDSPDNGYTNNAIGFQTRLNNKLLGFPEIPETPVMRREFWVSAKGNIAIRMIADNGSFHTVSFKPNLTSYYYVTGSYKSGEVFVYEVYKTEKGYYDKKPVTDLQLKNCDDGSFRFQKF